MSGVDPATYERLVAQENAEAMRRADELSVANQLAQFKTGSPQQGTAAPKAAQYLELPTPVLPSTAAELRQVLKEAIASYRKKIEDVRTLESKLREARQAEATAVNDDSENEKRIVQAVGEAMGLQSVFSRRLELARQKVPAAFVAILPVARALAQELTNRCYALASERADRHRTVLRPRFDHEAFIRTVPTGYPVSYEGGLDRLISCTPDVINAQSCIPRFNFLARSAMPANLSFQQLQLDLDALERAEVAYQAEADRQYDFQAPAEVEVECQPVEA